MSAWTRSMYFGSQSSRHDDGTGGVWCEALYGIWMSSTPYMRAGTNVAVLVRSILYTPYDRRHFRTPYGVLRTRWKWMNYALIHNARRFWTIARRLGWLITVAGVPCSLRDFVFLSLLFIHDLSFFSLPLLIFLNEEAGGSEVASSLRPRWQPAKTTEYRVHNIALRAPQSYRNGFIKNPSHVDLQ
ncbi:uncharacterized protein CIMG_03085 [Coccidioides immitis RS]|uniref:Uncharacterized protein n=1 Tax=Coccidioides immitis (strain RS) TaxID=246410 RepID=J3KAK5_COCIM|nr:uncharacterized protein CIMG_03085 [Coccidioides immitis RS]EAS32061.3 hypothetical protein CIMG_03085 [Coccidioides immitis RS]